MTIEMLWEQDDPDAVLRDRFGFASAEAVGDWVTSVVERQWGLRVESPERVVMSDRNALVWVRRGDERLLLKWSVAPDRFERLTFAAELTAWLGTLGLPVSAPVPTLAGEVQVTSAGISMGLQRVIDGGHLDVDDADQVRAAGATLARLHDALRECPLRSSRPEVLSVPAPSPSRSRAGSLPTRRRCPRRPETSSGSCSNEHLRTCRPYRSCRVTTAPRTSCAQAPLSSASSTSRSSDSTIGSASSLVQRSCSGRSSATGSPFPSPSDSSSWMATSRSEPSRRRNSTGGRSSCSGTPWHSCLPGTTPTAGVEQRPRYSSTWRGRRMPSRQSTAIRRRSEGRPTLPLRMAMRCSSREVRGALASGVALLPKALTDG